MSYLDEAARKVLEAQAAVGKAMQSGKSVDEINKANRRLADAHGYMRECQGGNVHDKR